MQDEANDFLAQENGKEKKKEWEKKTSVILRISPDTFPSIAFQLPFLSFFFQPFFLLVFHSILVYLCSHPLVSRLAFKKWYYLTKCSSFLSLTPCDPNDPKVRILSLCSCTAFIYPCIRTLFDTANFDFTFLSLIYFDYCFFSVGASVISF